MSERRKLRFGVRAEDGRRSRVWTVATVAGGADVYLSPGQAPAAFHFSLHSDTYWHMKMVHAAHVPAVGTADPMAVASDKQVPLELIPRPFMDGRTRAFVLGVSPGGLGASHEVDHARVRWYPPAASVGHWTHFNVFLEAPGTDSSWEIPGATSIGRIRRGDGGCVLVTHHEAPLDVADLIAPVDLGDRLRGLPSADGVTAMIVIQNDDDSWRVVEGPVEALGPDGFDIACDHPWRPTRSQGDAVS